MISPLSWISMEGFFAEKPNSTELHTNSEQIDLTLKLSPCGQNAEEKMLTAKSSMVANGAQEGPFVLCVDRCCSLPAEGQKGLVRFGDLQTMRRVRTGKRLLLEKLRRAAAAEADKSLAVSTLPPAGAQPLARSIDKFKTLANPHGDSWHEGGASSNVQTSPKQGNEYMVSPKAMKEMPLWPSYTEIESPAKKFKHVNPYDRSDATDVRRQMPSVTTAGDGPSGKRIEWLLYKYKRGQVSIVSVCHGSFLSPAEFVGHAGSKEVADPMKHITVCSDSFYINGDGAGFITHPF